MYVKEDGDHFGFVSGILRAMQEKFGFRFKFSLSIDGKYGTLVNGTWNGFIQMILDDTVDMVATGFAMTPDRMSGK